jgi:tetratricopeptide (TPR) repeat protein
MRALLKRSLPYLLLAVAVVAVYLPSLGNDFTNWDDNAYVYENPRIFHLNFENLVKILDPRTTVAEDWTPLVTLTHVVEYRIFGLEPGPYHATNLLLHVGATLATFALLLTVGVPFAVAFAGALLFGIHPLQVESVAWISGRKNLLATFLGFASILVYLRGTRRAHRWALALLVLASLSKGIAIVIPPLLVATLLCSGRAIAWRQEAVRLAPFFAVALARGLGTVMAQSEVWARTATLSFAERMTIMGGVVVSYLRQFFFPAELRAFYGWSPHVEEGWLLAGWLLVLGLAILVFYGARRSRWIAYLGVFVPITLSPMLNVFPAPFFQADRYVYMAVPAVAALAAAPLYMIAGRLGRGWIATAVLAIWCAVIVVPSTLRLIPTWADSYTLWNHTLRYEPSWHVAFNNLGLWYDAHGDHEQAIQHYEQALAIKPNFFEPRLNLAIGYYRTDRDAEAEALFRRILVEAESDRPRAHHGLAQLLHKVRRYPEAEEEYRKALALDPDNLEALTNLGTLVSDLGRSEESLALYDRALHVRPDDPAVLNNRGNALRSLGRVAEAEQAIRRALVLDPEYANAYSNLAAVLVDTGRAAEAIPIFRRALEIDPELAAGYSNLGNAYFAVGDVENALATYERALEIEPEFAEALNNSANALSASGRTDEARQRYLRALELRPEFPEAKYGLGRLLFTQGKPKEALPLLRDAHRARPSSIEGSAILAHAAWQSGDLELAGQSFAHVIRLQPGRIPAYQNLARLLMQMDRPDDAEILLRKAISMVELPDLLEQLAGVINGDTARAEEVAALQSRARELRASKGQPTPTTTWVQGPQEPPR